MNIFFRHTVPKQVELKGGRAPAAAFLPPPRHAPGHSSDTTTPSATPGPRGGFGASPSTEPAPLAPRHAVFSWGFSDISSGSPKAQELTPISERSFFGVQSLESKKRVDEVLRDMV